MMSYKKYKPGDTVFLNGNRLTIKSVDPKIYGSQNNYYIYADTVWAEAIIACREKYGRDRVPFVAEIPDYKQSSRWPYRSREKWSALMQYADRVNQYAPQNKGKSYAYILNQRNIGMISACDILIAVYNGDATGGTANGVRDGRRLDKWIVTIPPQSI